MQRRNTLQREIIYGAVLGLKNHPTADEVYGRVLADHPTISRATVYRNLNLLSEEGKLRRIEVPEGPDRYDHFLEPHYHFHCVGCGKVFDVKMPMLRNPEAEIEDTDGFSVIAHDVIFKGYCRDCQKSNS